MMKDGSGLDKIGEWSIDKLNILRDYSAQYAAIVAGQQRAGGERVFTMGYIDGFAGAGKHVRRTTNEEVPGSPAIALSVTPKFDECHFVDLDSDRVDQLRELCAKHPEAQVYHGNCNRVLIEKVFPRFKFENFRRALCLLDPYGMHLNWEVMAAAGHLGTIDMFLNFPIADMNRNAKKKRIAEVDPAQRARMTAFWGNEEWHPIWYPISRQTTFLAELTGNSNIEPDTDKEGNEALVAAFQERLKSVGGFKYVPDPIPMKIPQGAIVYYLFFASNNATANRIAAHILKKYRAAAAAR